MSHEPNQYRMPSGTEAHPVSVRNPHGYWAVPDKPDAMPNLPHARTRTSELNKYPVCRFIRYQPLFMRVLQYQMDESFGSVRDREIA